MLLSIGRVDAPHTSPRVDPTMVRTRARRVGPDIIEFVTDRNLLNLTLSPAQETLLRAAYGLRLTKEQRGLYQLCTGRSSYTVGHTFSEITVVAGARSGKDSRIAAPIVTFEAFFGGHEFRLHKGEKAVMALVAQDRDAAGVAFSYIKSYVLGSPLLRAEVLTEPLTNELQLTSGIRILTFPCSLKSLRAYSIPVAVLDELAFYRLEGGANSDAEIQASVRRGMINFTNTRLVKISTPWQKEGVLHSDFERAYGQDDLDLLVWQASTALMNPSIDEQRLARERRMDPKRFAREFQAVFQDDVESFIPNLLIEQAIEPGRTALPAESGRFYVAGLDASGGGDCAFTLSIATVDLDARPDLLECQVIGWEKSRTRQLDLEGVVKEASQILLGYGITHAYSDKFSAGWSRQAFARYGVTLIDAPAKAELYAELEPLITSGRVRLLDHPRQNRELGQLERRPKPGGKASIGPPRGGRDDYCNAMALAMVAAAQNADLPPIDTSPTQAELAQLRRVFNPDEVASAGEYFDDLDRVERFLAREDR